MAKSTYKEALKYYEVGKISSLELLNYQRELTDIENELLNHLANFYIIKYNLELLLGLEIKLTYKE